MARGRGSGKKSGSKPTSSRRSELQDIKDRYAKAREDAQLAGLIPTTPEEALKPEAVKPGSQSDVAQPHLIAEAIRKGWAVPEERKPLLVDELVDIVYSESAPAKVKVAAFRALQLADQSQYERDHPEEAAKAKGGTKVQVNTTNNNTTNVTLGEVFSDIEVIEQSYARILSPEGDSQANGDLRAHSNAQPVDEAEPNNTKKEPKAD